VRGALPAPLCALAIGRLEHGNHCRAARLQARGTAGSTLTCAQALEPPVRITALTQRLARQENQDMRAANRRWHHPSHLVVAPRSHTLDRNPAVTLHRRPRWTHEHQMRQGANLCCSRDMEGYMGRKGMRGIDVHSKPGVHVCLNCQTTSRDYSATLWLVVMGQALPLNPAHTVRRPTAVVS
jgi:hypothetical protein